MRAPRPPLRWLASLGLLGVVAAFVSSAAPPAPVPSAAVPPTSAAPSAQGNAPAVSRPPPAAPEETATIHDDPTVAPDSQDSADNAVTFPSDI